MRALRTAVTPIATSRSVAAESHQVGSKELVLVLPRGVVEHRQRIGAEVAVLDDLGAHGGNGTPSNTVLTTPSKSALPLNRQRLLKWLGGTLQEPSRNLSGRLSGFGSSSVSVGFRGACILQGTQRARATADSTVQRDFVARPRPHYRAATGAQGRARREGRGQARWRACPALARRAAVAVVDDMLRLVIWVPEGVIHELTSWIYLSHWVFCLCPSTSPHHL